MHLHYCYVNKKEPTYRESAHGLIKAPLHRNPYESLMEGNTTRIHSCSTRFHIMMPVKTGISISNAFRTQYMSYWKSIEPLPSNLFHTRTEVLWLYQPHFLEVLFHRVCDLSTYHFNPFKEHSKLHCFQVFYKNKRNFLIY